ncbi:MAG: molybdate ABC transporter substrate-binding protein [Solirubrobacterales bacterium]
MRSAAGLLCVVLALAAAGCGSGGGSTSGDGDGELIVSAASSLQDAFTEYAKSFPDEEIKQSFAGSDTLAAQIRNGARPDVFASADTSYPRQLYGDGLVEKPRVFTANRLTIAVPRGSPIDSIDDLARPGTKLVIGAKSVPVGSYTLEVLGRLPAGERRAILGNVVSEEPEVSAVVGKLTQGAADAGFVYVTDARAAGADLKTVPIPPSLQPDVAYAVAIVKGAANPPLARRFVAGLFAPGAGAAALERAGFLPP